MGAERQSGVLAALLVFGGQLGDMFGRRRIFLAGTIVFAAASACAAVAPTFWLLILCRVVQGASGAAMLPTTVALVSSAFTGAQRGIALGHDGRHSRGGRRRRSGHRRRADRHPRLAVGVL